ncbi:uncharacterized protein [Prorops nasuta]|uniref:uncharacterized protein isoform X2 n=1 Tax=Prorops nasuta TaxID=863751 RepID=UPI0034CEF1BA
MSLYSVLAILLLLNLVNGRFVYLQDPEGRPRDPILPITFDNYEQSSRDLDLAFSAGEPNENNFVQPKKVYTVYSPEKPGLDIREERPIYYKLTEVPRRSYDDVIVTPERSRKLVKINNGNKGEVILELRVIANNHESV